MEDVVELGARRTQNPPANGLVGIESRVTELLANTLLSTLSACDDVLFGHAQRATNGMRQAQFFDDQRQLRNDREMAAQRFRAACRQAFRSLGRKQAQADATPGRDGELHLVADEDLELDLALFRIGKCCDDMAPRLRHQVQRRLQVLLGLTENATTPLCGAAIARMCRAAVAPVELGMESRLIVLKQLERQLSGVMESALELVNSSLLAQGVLPHLRATPTVARQPSSPASRASAYPGAATASAIAAVADTSAAPMSASDLSNVVAQVAHWLAQNAAAPPAEAQAPNPTQAAIASPEPEAAPDDLELARERRRLEIAERRTSELNRARELRASAERSAQSVLGIVLEQAHVPDSIASVMRGPLRRHLEAVHSRRGETSTEWRSACKLVRDIAWALDPETAASEQAHWREMVPGIVDSLRAALLSVGIVEHEVHRVVRGFGERYEQLLARESAAAPEAPALDAKPEGTQAQVVHPEVATPSFSDALRRVRQLVLGQWFELLDDHGQTQRAKLVWTSAMTERCLFVNGHGKLVADRPHARVAHDLVAGAFRAVDDAPCAMMA